MMNHKRARLLKDGRAGDGPVFYWMSRDQRVRDNWALLFAQDLALAAGRPLAVFFCLAPAFLGATLRHYGFMLGGLAQVEAELARCSIPFFLLEGPPGKMIPKFIAGHSAYAVVADYDPLRIKQQWLDEVTAAVGVPLHVVDAHNIVPCWVASSKQEYAAYTLRPKIRRLLSEYLSEFSRIKRHPYLYSGRIPGIDWIAVKQRLNIDRSVGEVAWITPGERAALRGLDRFVKTALPAYADKRNDPSAHGQSGLSPWLHFGHLSAQRVALAVMESGVRKASRDAFLEELIVRRELSDNFCAYNTSYDSVNGFPEWAKRTLKQHAGDTREFLYGLKEFEEGQTHDDLWNAAQLEMVKRGKMHGYLRMYWAKKILEWSESPVEAMKTAIYLNNRYELDGRDPNGYTGISWSIGGVHDRAWNERKVFGKIRYMSYNGCRSKFDVDAYIDYVNTL